MNALAPDHIQDLKSSGLTEETIREAGIYSLPPREINKLMGYNAPVSSLMVIPYPGTDFSRYKLFPELIGKDGHKQKYFQPKGTAPRLFVPPGFDCTSPLFRIVEGEKKALKGSQDGLNVLGLGGIWNFAAKNNGKAELISDLKNIPWKNKTVEIIPDGDFKNNDHVSHAVYRFAELLSAQGARVSIVSLPGNFKLDDYLIKHGKASFLNLPRISHKAKQFLPAKIAEDIKAQAEDGELRFPDVYAGACGLFAEKLSEIVETPKAFLYMAALTCLGSYLSKRITLRSAIAPEPRFYTLLIGESGDEKKSTALKKTVELFRDILSDFHVQRGVGSAEGLLSVISEQSVLLLMLDEFSHFVSKCNNQGSVLLPCTATLFENTEYDNRTKYEKIEIADAHLSILAASTRETFQKVWTPNFTNIGFDNRLLLIYEKASKSFAIPGVLSFENSTEIKKSFIEILAKLPGLREYELTPDARSYFDAWYMDLKARNSIVKKRIDTYALRLLPLFAVNEGQDIVTLDITKRVVSFCEWQIKVRELMAPVDAVNIVAELEEKIRRALKSKGSLKERDLQIGVNAYRAGLHFYKCAIGNLIENHEAARVKGFVTHIME